jgi:hypothetical protein
VLRNPGYTFHGDIQAIRGGGNLNPKKVAKRTMISHKKLLTKVGLHKGNVLRFITSDDHVINIKKKSSTTRRGVDKQCGIMVARLEANNHHNRGK